MPELLQGQIDLAAVTVAMEAAERWRLPRKRDSGSRRKPPAKTVSPQRVPGGSTGHAEPEVAPEESRYTDDLVRLDRCVPQATSAPSPSRVVPVGNRRPDAARQVST
jgi:hypothetical protein